MDGATTEAPLKDLYEVGEIPPLGHVPKQMYAWTIRRERHGGPGHRNAGRGRRHPRNSTATRCSCFVMAAGVNYNGVWAALGVPISAVRRSQVRPITSRARTRPGIVWKPSATRSSAGKSATRS